MTPRPLRRLASPGAGWWLSAALALAATPASAHPWGRPATPPPPPPLATGVPSTGVAPGRDTVYDNDPSRWGPTEAQLAQRCSLGRLVGGVLGGGVGYASSRKDGRAWAVPLGALLGSQVGCNVGAGRGPVPW
ncbi:MAG: glycine zipper 2TM domain-containing protein [Cyanobacteriota bacterium]|nr:glycine zipper 2TM domain-containing protein [Cyanobacteriota bacterium]